MTPNELRDLKEIAAGRSPVGNGTLTLAKAVLELLTAKETSFDWVALQRLRLRKIDDAPQPNQDAPKEEAP